MESAEHAWIGDQVRLTFESGPVAATGTPLQAAAGLLTYGECIALGGDFFGVVGGPISTAPDARRAFLAAHRSLTTWWVQVQPILAILAEEVAAVTSASESGAEPSIAYARLGDSLSMRWNRATGGGSVLSDLLPLGRYLALAAENWDHFGHNAVDAYRAGHSVAMELAARANDPGMSPTERGARLQEAYAMNAFADHFLTDLFSAGHLRPPRKELYDQIVTPVPGLSGSLGSLLVRAMHDEDCRHGLTVHNEAGDSWTAYGDKRLLDSVSADNRRVVVQATQASVDDVWEAYRSKRPTGFSALGYVPDLDRVLDVTSKENFSPLFRRQSGVVARRNDIADRQDFSWTTDWWGWSTYAALYRTREYQLASCRDMATGQPLGWLGSSAGANVKMVRASTDAHGVAWSFEGGDLYLRKKASPADRYLGLSSGGGAGWGLKGGWRRPVLYNADLSISLKSDPRRRLCRDGDWVRWSGGRSDDGLLQVDVPMTIPTPGPV